MVLLLIAAVGALSGFYLLLSVVPLYAAAAGAGGPGAGLVTGAMMLAPWPASAWPGRSCPRRGHTSRAAWAAAPPI